MTIACVNRSGVRLPVGRLAASARRIVAMLRARGYWKKHVRTIAIVFVRDEEGRALNRIYLKKNKPTNILSFDYGIAGELVLSPGVIRREARGSRRPFPEALTQIIIHGMVHLTGLHHERSRILERKSAALEEELFMRLENTRTVWTHSSRRPRSRRV